MPMTFYPNEEDLLTGTLIEKIEILLAAAENFKAAVLEMGAAKLPADAEKKRGVPRDITIAYNWDEIANILYQVRQLPEGTQVQKLTKAEHLTKLSEVYEVLRGAKMTKLEAVRIALMNEANQLRASARVA